jgi:hypothetical protein
MMRCSAWVEDDGWSCSKANILPSLAVELSIF